MAETITIRDQASSALQRLAASLSAGPRRTLMAAVGGRVRRRLQRHFRAREMSGESKRARKGWRSKHFWAGVERATAVTQISSNSVTVSIASPALSQKIHGGTITPKRGRYLAIPLRAEAYAKGSPREWDLQATRSENRLVAIRSRRGSLFLAQVGDGYQAGALGGRGIRAQYLLVRSVTQRPDPAAMPSDAALIAEVDAAAEDYITQRIARGGRRS